MPKLFKRASIALRKYGKEETVYDRIYARFHKDKIYHYGISGGYDSDYPKYCYVQPIEEDNGERLSVWCMIVNMHGEVCPAYPTPQLIATEYLDRAIDNHRKVAHE